MEDRLLEVGAFSERPQIQEVAMLADTKEGLVERGEALLAVQDERGMLRPIERGRAFDVLLDGRRLRAELGFAPQFPRLADALAAGA